MTANVMPTNRLEPNAAAADPRYDWDGWRNEIRSFCRALREQISLIDPLPTAGESCAVEHPVTARPAGPREEIQPPVAVEDRLAWLKRQLDAQIEKG